MSKIYNNPKGEAYFKLIDYAIENLEMFVIAMRHQLSSSSNCNKVFESLEPFLIKKISSNSLMGINEIAYSYGSTIYFYKCTKESGEVLKDVSDSLFSWQHPTLPEDLCFLNKEEKDWLTSVAHEKMASILVDETEAERLSREIPGLFLRGSFNSDIKNFINDAIRHKAEKIELYDFNIDKIPDKIGQIASLKELFIFEQKVNQLPKAIFNLTNLESLTILTEDLLEIPKEIEKLKNLKEFKVSCGSYTSIKSLKLIIKKENVSLKEIPVEIGNLAKLETLSINHTGIKRIPSEVANLKNLEVLDLHNNMIEELPEELKYKESFRYFNISENPIANRI